VTDDVRVQEAAVPELPDVLNVVDGAMLDIDTGRLRSAIDRGEVLVAVADGTSSEERRDTGTDRVVGVLVLDGEEITAVAVRRRRRGQGIGTRLVEAAADRRERLVADFDPRVDAFWASLGFEIEALPDSDRFRGVR
jgi:GNAT superfamily N-acetyltransferase